MRVPESLVERTIPGLHALCFERLKARRSPPASVLDLGAGTGAWANRLTDGGYLVTAIERSDGGYLGRAPVIHADLNLDFATEIHQRFDVVTCLEVIEHVENPTGLLRQVRTLLTAGGLVLVTTPNNESTSGRMRFLWAGELRHFGRGSRFNEPTHLTPIHSLLFERITSAAGLRIVEAGFDRPYSSGSRVPFRLLARALDPFLRGDRGGDTHVYFLAIA